MAKRTLMIDGSAACFKSSFLEKFKIHKNIKPIKCDLIDLMNDYPNVYSKPNHTTYGTISWYIEYKIGEFKTHGTHRLAIFDRSPFATFVYSAYHSANRPSVSEFEEMIPSWFKDYAKYNPDIVFIIDSDIKKCLNRIVKRNFFDVEFASEEYCDMQNKYFSKIGEVCNIEVFDINGRDKTIVDDFLTDKIKKIFDGEIYI